MTDAPAESFLRQGNQDRLLFGWHEMDLAKIEYRIAMLEMCLKVGPDARAVLKQIFRVDTGEDLLSGKLESEVLESAKR